MPFLDLIDETLDINSTENYDLSVEISPDSLTFLVLDSIRNKYVLLRSYLPEPEKQFSAEELAEKVVKDEFLTKKYRRKIIITPTWKFTLVPSPLFDPGKKDDYFLFNHSMNENQVVLVNRLRDPDSYLIYSQLRSLNEIIERYWPASEVFHHLKPHLMFASGNSNDYNDHLFIHAEKEFFNITVFGNNNLILCNSYTYRSAADILYYTLNVVRSLGLKQETSVVLSGNVKKRDELHINLSEYLKNLRFAGPAANNTFSYVMNEIDLYRYVNLITAVNCA